MKRKFFAVPVIALVAVAIVALSSPGASPVQADPGPSVNVAIINSPVIIKGGTLPTAGADFAAFNFFNTPVASIAALTTTACGGGPCDTVVLNVASPEMNCTTATLSVAEKNALNAFVAGGGKMIIYDSECQQGVGVDYTWMTYPFTTSNPGALGAQRCPLDIMEENTLSTSTAGPYYIDTPTVCLYSDAVGDMNTMVTRDPNWCLDMEGTNALDVKGPVHTYAGNVSGSTGLFIYNGLDMDPIAGAVGPSAGGQLAKIWLQELQQPFNPDDLSCGVPVVVPGVGGMVEMQVGGSASPASLAGGSGSSSLPYALIAGAAAAAAVVLSAGALYARRRWLR